MRERPTFGAGPASGPDRRQALALLSSAMAVVLARCTQPQEEIVPYVDMPERLVPGEPLRFATALSLSGYGRGVLGITIDGHPIKIEGNPRHPYSLGATDVFAEGEVLSLYDPDRSRTPLKNGQIASWPEFVTEWTNWIEQPAYAAGAGMALVTGRITSPTLLRAVQALKGAFPGLRQYRYEPVHDDNARMGARAAFGQPLEPLPYLDAADVVVALGGDPLGPGPSLLRNARAFAERRRSAKPQRLYAIESEWTLTGASADHRLAAPAERIAEIGREIASPLKPDLGPAALTDAERAFAAAVASDVMQPGVRSLFLAGRDQPASVHALCHWLNGMFDAPVDYVPPADPIEKDHGQSFVALLSALRARTIQTLIVIDANPVYDAAEATLAASDIAAVPFSIHCGLYKDETGQHCRWHLPLSHILESWGDLRSPDGTAALVQPLIRPLYDGKTAAELLTILAGGGQRTSYNLTQETWRTSTATTFDVWWRDALLKGALPGSAAPAMRVTAKPPALPAASVGTFSMTVSPHPSLWDGRYANNAWLQECPAPFTKEVWGSAISISPEDASRLGIQHGNRVVLRRGARMLDAVAAVLAGKAPGSIEVFLGGGRWAAGAIGTGVGSRFASLGDGDLATRIDGVALEKRDDGSYIVETQTHTQLEGRDKDLFPLASMAEIGRRLAALEPSKIGIVPALAADEYAWAMVIDNDLCIGCNACVIACQAENNIAVVGPEEVSRGRDMHWLRIDAYELASPEQTRRGFQPVPCMHCETAPCEPVCPVEASVHDHEGLNVQVYNRCIGTRFCEANCPYKVRRFNYFGYARGQEYGNLGQPPLRAQRNPNVSVRGRGVMEKCTYCVQRISSARHQAEKENRAIAEGEVVTACQAACPTRAIHFGNRNDKDSDVARLRGDARHYALLGHLDTRPRTTYLAKAFNENPALETKS